jgi:hypothetical protein
MMAEHMEGAWGVTEAAGDLFGGFSLDEVSAEGLVLALSGQLGLEKEAAELT